MRGRPESGRERGREKTGGTGTGTGTGEESRGGAGPTVTRALCPRLKSDESPSGTSVSGPTFSQRRSPRGRRPSRRERPDLHQPKSPRGVVPKAPPPFATLSICRSLPGAGSVHTSPRAAPWRTARAARRRRALARETSLFTDALGLRVSHTTTHEQQNKTKR